MFFGIHSIVLQESSLGFIINVCRFYCRGGNHNDSAKFEENPMQKTQGLLSFLVLLVECFMSLLLGQEGVFVKL